MALNDFFTPCIMMDEISQSDGYGGITTTLIDGARFDAAIAADQSTEAKIAYQNGLKVMFTVITTELVTLKQGDVIKRVKDGLMIRITSDAADMHTPPMASQQYQKVTGEAVKI